MSAKNTKSDVLSYFENAKDEFLAKSHTVSSTKRLLNTSCHLR